MTLVQHSASIFKTVTDGVRVANVDKNQLVTWS